MVLREDVADVPPAYVPREVVAVVERLADAGALVLTLRLPNVLLREVVPALALAPLEVVPAVVLLDAVPAVALRLAVALLLLNSRALLAPVLEANERLAP